MFKYQVFTVPVSRFFFIHTVYDFLDMVEKYYVDKRQVRVNKNIFIESNETSWT